MKGFESTGMVLAAKSADGSKVELVNPPADAAVGDRLVIPGVEGDPWPAAKVKKLKVWEAMSADLATNEQCVVCWKGQQVVTASGQICSVVSNANTPVS